MSVATAEPGTILVVDDTPTNLEILFDFLTNYGFKILIAEDGESALQKAEYAAPDLILLDILMPGIDGFETCSRLKANEATRDMPVIFMTALSETADKVRGLQVGAVDYVTKPLQHEEVLARVQTHLRLRSLTKQLQAQNVQLQQEIEQRQRHELALRQSEERFQLIARATNDAVWDWDLVNDRVWWNEGVQTLFGYALDEVGTNAAWWYERIHPADRERVVTHIRTAIGSHETFWIDEYRYRRANGSYAYVIDRGYITDNADKQPVRMLGGMMDISERVRAEQELQRQYQRSQLFAEVTLKIRQSLQLEAILQAAAIEVQNILQADRVLIYHLRSDGTGSGVAEAVLPGWSAVLGQQFSAEVFPEDYRQLYCQGRIRSIADVEREEKIAPCLVEFVRQFQVKAKLVVPIIIREELWGLLIAHQCSSPRDWTDFETELLRQLADQIGIALTQAQLLEQETRYSQELARSNAELQQFASIASHDLQEPLRKIQAFGNRLQEKYGEALSEQGADYIKRMQNAAQRMQILIDDLLVFSRITTKAQPFVAVNLANVAKEVLSDLEVLIQQTGAHVELGELPTINADPLQMRQLLQNLIGNALKFHRENEAPRVKIYSQIHGNREQLTENSPDTHFYQITVEDNGIGFDQKYCDRIFQVFQRLHGRSEYEGTGIGLAICRKIVERHGGSITAESTPSQGAKFIVTLPVHQSLD